MANKMYMVDGTPYEVSEEKEEQFLADMKKQNKTPVLKSDEPGKSQGTSPSQKTKKKQDTVSKSEDGSSESPMTKDEAFEIISGKSYAPDYKPPSIDDKQKIGGRELQFEPPKYSVGNKNLSAQVNKSKEEINQLLDSDEFIKQVKSGDVNINIANDDELSEKLTSKLENFSPEIGRWQSYKNSLSNAIEQTGDVVDFWGLNMDGKTIDEAAEDGTLGARGALNIASGLIWEGVFGRETVKRWAEKNPGFWKTYNPSDSETFMKMIESFQEEKDETKQTMTFAEADSFADYMTVAGGAVVNAAGSVAYNIGTLGSGFFMDYAAENFIEANKIKAESENKTLEELLKDNDADIAAPIKIAAFQTGLEMVGLGKILKPLGKNANKLLGKKLTNNYVYSKPTRMGLDMLSTGSTEMITEMGQTSLEDYNKELAIAKSEGKDINDMLVIAEGMFTPKAIEAGLQGFFGGAGLRGGSYSANALGQIRQTVDDGDVEADLRNLVDLTRKSNQSTDEVVKAGLDSKIEEIKININDKIKKGNDIYQTLSEGNVSKIEKLGDLADVAAFRVTELNKKLDKGDISKETHQTAVEGLSNKYADSRKKIRTIINNAAIKEQVQAFSQRTGREGKVTNMTSEEISNIKEEGFDSKQASNQFGFIKQHSNGDFEIVLNKDKTMEGTAAHEFMHAVLFKTLGANKKLQTNLGNALEEHVMTLGGDLTNVGVRLGAYGDWVTNKDGKKEFVKDDNFGEETITIMSESILDGTLRFDEGFFTKVGDIIRRFGQNYLNHEIRFDTGRDVYNFIKDYNKSIEDGKVNEAIMKVAAEGAKGRLVEGETQVEAETTAQMSKDAKPSVDELGRMGWTKDTWKKQGANFAIKEMQETGMLDRLIASKLKVPMNVSKTKEFVQKVYAELTPHAKSFNPEINDSFFGWMNSQIANKAGNVYNREYKVEQRTQDIDARTEEGAPVVQVEADTQAEMDFIDQIGLTEKQGERYSKLRRDIGLDKGMMDKVRQAVVKTFGTKLPDVESKKFKSELQKRFRTELKKPIQDMIGSRENYDKFLNNNFEAVHKALPVETLVQMERNLPAEQRIFTESRRITKPTEVDKLVSEGRLPKDTNRLSGPQLHTKKRYPGKDKVMAFFRGVDMENQLGYKVGASTLGTRKDKLAMEMGVELAFDATMETTQQPGVQERRKGILELEGKVQARNEAAIIAKQIDRDPTIKFSKIMEQVEDMFVKYAFQIEGSKVINDVLKGHKDKDGKPLKPINPLTSKEDVVKYVEDLKTHVLPLMPRDFWFGKPNKKGEYGTVFTPGNRVGKLKEAGVYDYYKKEMEKLRSFDGFGESVDGVTDYSKSSYQTLFKNPESFKKNVKAFNNKVSKIHEAFWMRSHKAIKANPNAASTIGNYLKLTVHDSQHWHKFGAQATAYSPNPKGKWKKYTDKKTGKKVKKWTAYEFEHAMPATAAYLYLLDSALEKGVNFEAAYSLVMDNYKLIALDAKENQKLNDAGYARIMPPNWSVVDNAWWERYFNEKVAKQGVGKNKGIDPNKIIMLDGKTLAETFDIKADGNPRYIKPSKSEMTKIKNLKKAHDTINQYSKDGKTRGMSTFDFDETVGISENFIIAKKGKETKKIASNEWPMVGDQLAKEGWKFDFTDFNKVTKGKPGPLFDKMKNQIKKYGPDNVFILTARAPESQKAIHDWLKSEGINIPIKNITGLGDSTGEAKGNWMLEKFAEGYNDMYFVDDALSNVKAVREVLDQLDIKSKVVQAKTKVKVGGFLVDVTTQEGRDFIKQYNEIQTVSTTDPDLANRKIKFSKDAESKANYFANKLEEAVKKRREQMKTIEADLKKKGYTINPTSSSSEFKRIGGWIIDTRTKEGKEFVRDLENIPTVSSSDPGRVTKFSKAPAVEFNEILQQTKGVKAGKVFSAQEARKIGIGKGKNIFKNFFVPPSAEDFKGLLYAFIGRGEKGNAHAAFFKDKLLDPYAKANRDWNAYKQAMSDDYKTLKKQFKGVSKRLNKKVKGTVFTNDNAIRTYLWDKAEFGVPGLSEDQKQMLVNHVKNDSDLKQFADGLSIISRVPDGYIEPSDFWAVESIASDLSNTVKKVGRKDFFTEWKENIDEIFSTENLNKIEAIYGTGFRNELEKVLYRMETGQNRKTGRDAQVNMLLDWINGSVGAVMFFNMRSASLQTISMANFINMADNNPVAAAKAFANMPQYIKDFSYIFNSDMLKQRRAGLQIDVSANELTSAFKDGKSKPQAITHYLLEKGFTPTQIADSFAIAAGGATFYRNRLNKLIKDGVPEAKAKKQAWLDFQEIAEETQQSSRPDLISNQQAGPLGRLILAWQNTPMQMTRLMKKKMSDFVNRRKIPGYTQFQSDMANISGIAYYGFIQNIYFGALQTGLMFMLFGTDDDEERKEKLEKRVANGALDSILRGTGIYGAAVSTLKNVLMKWKEEREKPGWKRENMNIAQEAVNLSPPLGTKMRKIMSAIRTEEWNKGVSKEIGFRIENPNLSIAANWTEALTNLPVARLLDKANNIEEAVTGNHQTWQRIALLSGWSKWSLGVVDEELEKAKEAVKEKKKAEKKAIKDAKKEEKKKQEEAEKKSVEEKKKKEGIKKVRCSAIKSSGKRCNMMVETKNKTAKCIYHKELTDKEKKEGTDRDNDGIREFRCTANKKNGERCKNRTENKNKKCYAHQ